MRLERFSKNELNQQGYKLVFFDLSALFNLMKDKNKIDEFKESNIRPVVNLQLVSEFLKGLDPAHKDYEEFYQKKKDIMQFFDDMNAYWILSHNEIVSFEFVHAYHGGDKNAHDYFKIFCASPLFVQDDINEPSCSYVYPCDNVMKFSYGLSDGARTYQKLLEELMMDPSYLEELKEMFNTGTNNNNEKKLETSLRLAGVKTQEEKKQVIWEHIGNYVRSLLSRNFFECEEKKLKDLIVRFFLASQQTFFLSYAPFYSVEDAIYWKYIEKCKDEKLKKNDFMDSIHARTALSYCDCFIVDDDGLKTASDEIIKEMQLKVKCETLMNFEIKSDRAHVLQD